MESASINRERWASLTLMEQMANIGSEVGRTRKWMEKGNVTLAEGAFYRCLDLIDATIEVGRKNSDMRTSLLYELCRVRELFAESFLNKDIYNLSYLDKYCGQFAAAVRRGAC